MPFQIIRNDITKVKADAIVNTANPKPICASGTDHAIYEAAGREALLAERKTIGNIERGEVAYTKAYNLDAKYIIHTVGPVWVDGNSGELDILRSCYEKSLNLALTLGCESIAFPLIATGVYGFPKDKALATALNVIQTFLLAHKMKVILVVFDKTSFELSGNIIGNIREYVDTNYVDDAKEREYSRRYTERVRDVSVPSPKKVSIDEMMATSDKTFQEKLFEIIDERGLTGPQVYKNYISKQVYSKILADKDYHPNKYTAIALCLSLRLSLSETIDLLGRAGWTLSTSNKADLVVRACIQNGEYNVVNINCILFDYDCEELEKIK